MCVNNHMLLDHTTLTPKAEALSCPCYHNNPLEGSVTNKPGYIMLLLLLIMNRRERVGCVGTAMEEP